MMPYEKYDHGAYSKDNINMFKTSQKYAEKKINHKQS